MLELTSLIVIGLGTVCRDHSAVTFPLITKSVNIIHRVVCIAKEA